MPPRTSSNLQSAINTFSADDRAAEVACPLRNNDGSGCRKRCLGEKRYRSMQEHIRRAHPEYYLPKLPATKESFELMITSAPHAVADNPPQPSPNSHHVLQNHHAHHQHHPSQHHPGLASPGYPTYDQHLAPLEGYHALGDYDGGYHTTNDTGIASAYPNMSPQERQADHYRRGSIIPTGVAAQALASLQFGRPGSGGCHPDAIDQNFYHNDSNDLKPEFVDPALEDAPFMNHHASFDMSTAGEQAPLSGLNASPPGRDAVPSLQRGMLHLDSAKRNRKSSLSQARLPKHERKRSRDPKRIGGDKKSLAQTLAHAMRHQEDQALDQSAGEFPTESWHRFDALVEAARSEAANSATEGEGPDDREDMTPIPQSPFQSPPVPSRASMAAPFGLGGQFSGGYQNSPLGQTLTPPNAGEQSGLDLQNFTESISSGTLSHQHHNSADSGSQFHIMHPSSIDTNSSPVFTHDNGGHGKPEIYCNACRKLNYLMECFACTNCISGICRQCYEALMDNQIRGRNYECQKCHRQSEFKPFNVDLRPTPS